MVRFTAVPAALLAASASQAGPYVAYISGVPVHSPSPDAKILVYDVASGATTNASEGLFSARAPAWSPDGTRLAFEAIEEGYNDLFVCAPDGSGRANVTQTPERWESAPAFVDAGRLVYLEGADRTDLWLLDLATGEKTQLTGEPAFHGSPVVSPDGRLVAVVAAEKLAGPGDVLLIDLADNSVRNLTEASALYSQPAFSPDGESVAFCFDGRDIGGATRGLAIVPIAGGEPMLITRDGYPLAPVHFSGDGARLAYTSADTYHSTAAALIDLDGANRTQPGVGSAHISGWPGFSPDGALLACQAVYAARYTIRLVDLATAEARIITPEGETGVQPVFSPR
jgi:Tol biopolymer transport system component